MFNKKQALTLFILAGFLISACSGGQEPQPQSSQPTEPAVSPGQTAASEEPDLAVDEEALKGQSLQFEASDGTQLNGIYYPAGVENVPLIILMHWAPGDMSSYQAIAYWLQNRGLGGEMEAAGGEPWLDSSWFPAIDPQKTYAVFTFTFRNCEGGCQSFLRDAWLEDAKAAVAFAYGLDSIKKGNILLVGASIGSDGAADGCLYLNELHPGSCQGAFSVSPGDYLTQSYQETVIKLGQADPAVPAWCLYAQEDTPSAEICAGFTADNFTAYELGDDHGMQLIRPDVDPNPLQLLLDFIAITIDRAE